MFKRSVIAILIGCTTTAGGCASILSKSDWPVSIQSTPSGIPFTISNKSGQMISSGNTPQTVTLKSGAGYFSPERYTVTFTSNGVPMTREITTDINGWYIANILFGGLIGLLIVDPLTGAMYRLPESVTTSYAQPGNTSDSGARILRIVSMQDLTPTEREQLIPVS